jgi:hypothetical protein
MTARELVDGLCRRGIRLSTRSGRRLHVDAPKGTITPGLIEALQARKDELLAILAEPCAYFWGYPLGGADTVCLRCGTRWTSHQTAKVTT